MGISESKDKYIQKFEHLQWYLIRTMPRTENKVEIFFKTNGIPCYLPKANRTYLNNFTGKSGKQYSYKRPAVLQPMFPGYIFAALDVETMSNTRYQRSVAEVCLHSNYSEEELIADLRKVQDFEVLAQNNQIEIRPEIVKGTPVILEQGPFTGWTGVVEKRLDNNFLFIHIEALNYSLGIKCLAVDCQVLP